MLERVLRFAGFLSPAAAIALLLSGSLGAIAHEHLEQTDSQCRICEASGAESSVLHDGPALPSSPEAAGPGIEALPPALRAAAAAPGAPRAPPA